MGIDDYADIRRNSVKAFDSQKERRSLKLSDYPF